MYRRIREILANEGLSGLLKRVICRFVMIFNRSDISAEVEMHRQRHVKRKEDFLKKAAEMGYGDLSNYYWYHTIDLGNGLITPGDYDYRSVLHNFGFPEDMSGMRVMDIGSHTGFFAFEFEKRGASVVSVELPAITDLDVPFEEDKEKALKELMAKHRVNTVKELYHCVMDGPFQFCRKVLNSNVKRIYSNIYDLSAEKIGFNDFDLVFIGDLLQHIYSPLKALVAVAPLCKKLVISQRLYESTDKSPVMLYVGGDKRCVRWWAQWWFPNKICFEKILKRVGFRNVEIIGYHIGFNADSGSFYPKRSVILATK